MSWDVSQTARIRSIRARTTPHIETWIGARGQHLGEIQPRRAHTQATMRWGAALLLLHAHAAGSQDPYRDVVAVVRPPAFVTISLAALEAHRPQNGDSDERGAAGGADGTTGVVGNGLRRQAQALNDCPCRVCVLQLGESLDDCEAKLGLDCSCYVGPGLACPCNYCLTDMGQSRDACEQLLGLDCACHDALSGAAGQRAAAETGACELTGGTCCLVLSDVQLSVPMSASEMADFLQDGPMAFADGLLIDCDGQLVASCDDDAIRDMDELTDLKIAPFDKDSDGSTFTVEFRVPSAAAGQALLDLFRIELTDRTSMLLSTTDDGDVLTHILADQDLHADIVDTTVGQSDLICPDLQARVAEVHQNCCIVSGEDCSTGEPSTCDLDCALVLLPFISDCAPELAKTSGAAFDFEPVRQLCLIAHVHH